MLGRATAAYQARQRLNDLAPGYGGVLGVSLGLAALHGNLRLTVERGGHSLEDLVDAVIRGEAPPQVSGRKSSFCGT